MEKKTTKKLKKKTTKLKKKAGSQAVELTTDPEEATAETGRRPAVDYADFVRTWSSSDSLSDVAAQLGIANTSATAIAIRLRKGGVELKRFPRRGAQPIDAKRLNRIVAGKD